MLSIPVYEHLNDDIPKSIKPWLEELLEHYKVHVTSILSILVLLMAPQGVSYGYGGFLRATVASF